MMPALVRDETLDLAAAGVDDARVVGDEGPRGKSGKRGQAAKQAEDCEAAGSDRHGLTKLKTAMLVPRYIGNGWRLEHSL